MRFPLCICASWGLLLSASDAFSTKNVALQRRRAFSSQTSIWSTQFTGWDNDNFLDSLSSGNSEQANEEYYQMSRFGRPEEEEPQQQQEPVQQPPPPPPPPRPTLPLGWTEHFDPISNQVYYANEIDGTTTWERPLPESSNDPTQQTITGMSYQEIIGTVGNQQSVTSNSPAVGTVGDALLSEHQQGEELPSEDLEGAKMTDEMKTKIKESHTEKEEASQGGERFRMLLQRAQNQQQSRVAQPAATASIQLPPNAMSLPLEEQARLYREIQWRQKHPEVEVEAKPTYLGPGFGVDGRKIGRNRDWDVVANSADVYFAKLKRDSTTRNLARYSGDQTKANAVFHDPTIEEIEAPEENPYLKEKRERERNMLETVSDEMLIFQEYDPPDKSQTSNSGISYKDKLAQSKASRSSREQN